MKMNSTVPVAPIQPKAVTDYASDGALVLGQRPLLLVFALVTFARLIYSCSELAGELAGPLIFDGSLAPQLSHITVLVYWTGSALKIVIQAIALCLAVIALRNRPEKMAAASLASLTEGVLECLYAVIWPIMMQQQMSYQNMTANTTERLYYAVNAGLTSLNFLCSAGIAIAFFYVMRRHIPRRERAQDVPMPVSTPPTP